MAGPYAKIDLGDGVSVDLYLLRYDEDGRLLSPSHEASRTTKSTYARR